MKNNWLPLRSDNGRAAHQPRENVFEPKTTSPPLMDD